MVTPPDFHAETNRLNAVARKPDVRCEFTSPLSPAIASGKISRRNVKLGLRSAVVTDSKQDGFEEVWSVWGRDPDDVDFISDVVVSDPVIKVKTVSPRQQ